MNKRKRTKSPVRPHELRCVRTNVAGADLGAHEHWVCGPQGEGDKPNVRVFRTTTRQLQDLVAWLREQQVQSLAMESTSVYWIPLYELLEAAGIEVVLVNARHLRGVPGRKTDMIDCQWLQLLHSCGLLKGSFRPHESICRVRAVQRERNHLIAERTRSVQRMQKALDQMNIHVHHAVTDLTGKTGLAIVRAIVGGQRDPEALAELRDARCKKSKAQIAEHLTGNWRQEHLFNLRMALRRFDETNAMIADYDRQIEQWMAEFQPASRRTQNVPKHPNPAKERAITKRGEQAQRNALWRWAGVDLTRIDGISAPGAATILSEIGLDLRSFPNESHFVSWLRLSPPLSRSAGKPIRSSHRNGMGATRVAAVLRMAALSLSHSKTALGAYYRRISRRQDAAVAVFATARKLAQLLFRMLRYGQDYVDEGMEAYEAHFAAQQLRRLTQSAAQLGYKLVPVAAAA